MASQTIPDSHQMVHIHLKDTQSRESISERTIHLLPPNYEVKIGRGSQTEPQLHPQTSNAWFTSRVMSREHAILRVNPDSKQIYLEDAGSMHGTYVGGMRLAQGDSVPIRENQKIQFGAEIVRGDQIYNPLELGLQVDWNDDYPQSSERSRTGLSATSKNSFSIDYSEDEEEKDDDLELVYETTRSAVAELERQSRTFSVPDSDDSGSSDVEMLVEEDSAPSSPADLSEIELKKTVAQKNQKDSADTFEESIIRSVTTGAPGSSSLNALNVSDDEEDHNEKNVKTTLQEVDDPSVYSDEDHEFSDNDVDVDDPYSDLDDFADEEEADGFSARYHHDIPEGSVPNESHPRAPSPSDAAMPKQSWYPPNNLPTIQDLVERAPSPNTMYCDTYPTGGPPLAHFHPFGYYTGMNWAPNDGNGSFVSGSFDHGFGMPLPPNLQQPAQRVVQNVQQPARPFDFVVQKPVANSAQKSEPSLTPVKDDTPIKPSKVSINDIIDDMPPVCAITSINLKRKADEISASTTLAELVTCSEGPSNVAESTASRASAQFTCPPSSEPGTSTNPTIESQPVLETVPEKATSSKKSVSFSPDAVIIDSGLERPRKKIKTRQENQGSPFLKYVATAVAGATLGAVGTIFGLAALPADYFV